MYSRRFRGRLGLLLVCLVCPVLVQGASDVGIVRGIVHDPQHRPIPGAAASLAGKPGSRSIRADENGEFEFETQAGVYSLTITAPGFQELRQQVDVGPGKGPVLHFQLDLGGMSERVEVSGATAKLGAENSTVQTTVSPREIQQTPGADQTNSLAMITDFTPGAYMVHDMLHMRGGHQVNWFFDGIPVINTNIAANVAPLINPKDVAELQTERGGYSSQYGDRTYGFFNVVTPSGFDRNNEAEVVASAGNFYSTDDQFNIGGHTDKFAYYASANGNRSQLGLETPVAELIHDQESGFGGFLSLLYNPSSRDQFRWIVSARSDHYQIPNTPEQQAAGIRDLDLERDTLVGFSWNHTFSENVLFSLTPYYHFNNAHFVGGPNDTPYILNDNVRSSYIGGRSVLQVRKARHAAAFGVESWGQRDDTFFGLADNPGGQVLNQRLRQWANSTAAFAEDQYKPASWLTLDLGLRATRYTGLIAEGSVDPRIGAAIRIPRLNWTIRGYYAYYYQPPPLASIAGPALQFAAGQGYDFVPLHGEHDIQHDFGLTIPLAGWALEADNFHTSARNFLDHDVIGNSGIFVPLTDLGAIIDGTEVSVRSPWLMRRAQLRMVYSNQIARGISPVTGGLLDFSPGDSFLLDHDQRNTASAVLSLRLPHGMWATPAYQFGSGFLDGNGPAHLPPHSTFDLSVGKRFGEKWTVSANAVNIGNSRYLMDTSNTFGGTHYINPRQIYAEVRYRFHF